MNTSTVIVTDVIGCEYERDYVGLSGLASVENLVGLVLPYARVDVASVTVTGSVIAGALLDRAGAPAGTFTATDNR